MTTLTDQQIIELNNQYPLITPFRLDQVQPASYDVTLDGEFSICVNDDTRPSHEGFRDTMTGEEHGCHYEKHRREWYDMQPGEFILGTIVEAIHLPANMLARLEGKSTLGRMGVAVHVTAGFGDPGFEGTITLELKNESQQILRLTKGQRIGQLVFERLEQSCARPYGHDKLRSHYQGQRGVTTPRL
ncbi:dCTP deaminase [Bifidobacterium cuniculi]|uniref:Deoxycytidine triphosphate deaminase n=1 Tax=Bifidobacterium cuniculi TaxID=1688 RepID=A0A087B501_9BIFI|nr:dCTP deaminase [Bifidobacterium cuniculi]KFI66101.1 deoxycytidine triphosphate deaminase [Bifidobacterium cuniculi]